MEHDAMIQMEKACLLPVSVAGALMPDAHVGYGLPIGGVLATDNAVIPYAVGVDISCRMKMTVLDIPLRDLEQKQDCLTRAKNNFLPLTISTLAASTILNIGKICRARGAGAILTSFESN